MFAAISIPEFSLQAVLRHTPAMRLRPVALVDPNLPKPLIVQSTPAAKSTGVTHGMTSSQALARCQNLEIVARSTAQEASATEILLQTAYVFSPNIEATQSGVCTLELKGLGLEKKAAIQAWAQSIVQSLESLNLKANIGIGPTPDLALLAAHGRADLPVGLRQTPALPAPTPTPTQIDLLPGLDSDTPVVAAGIAIFATEDFVANLPLAALAPPPAISEILLRWGIRTIGEFLALGKTEVVERLGVESLALFDRVAPSAVRPLKLVSPPEHFSEQIEFEGEIETTAPLLSWLERFLEQLSQRLGAIYLVVAQLRLHLGLASGSKYERTFKIPSPTGDMKVLFRMLQTHLETLRTDSPIVSLQLVATPAGPEMHQFGLFQNTLRDPNQFADTLTRLTGLLGSDNVGTPVLETTHRPDAFRVQPPNFEFVPAQDLKLTESNDGLQFRRFRPPLPARFEFLENQPTCVMSKLFTGAVAGLRGPFLSSGNWWDDTRWAREEWDVELAGGPLLRLFRSTDGCFVEGVYD